MLPEELAKYKPLYLQTAWEYLRQLEASLTLLHVTPSNSEALSSAHICAHSLKGQSLMMHYTSFGELCHSLELYFKEKKEQGSSLSDQESKKLQGILISMKDTLSTIAAEDHDTDMSGEIHIVEELRTTKGDQ